VCHLREIRFKSYIFDRIFILIGYLSFGYKILEIIVKKLMQLFHENVIFKGCALFIFHEAAPL